MTNTERAVRWRIAFEPICIRHEQAAYTADGRYASSRPTWENQRLTSAYRQALGFSPKVWTGLTAVLSKAIPVLEQQSFSWKNPPATSFNGSSSDLIAAHYLSLVKDIERLNDLCTIARNLLATTKKAQNLAAEKSFDQQILKLIDVCVRVTARGFDGDTNARNEERWQKVVNLYKRLLITCLQFLHNFIMHNEHRKLVLWLDLFGNSQAAVAEEQMTKEKEEEVALTSTETRIKNTVENLPEGDKLTADGGLGYNIDDVHALFDLMGSSKEPDVQTQDAAKLLMDKIRTDMERLSGLDSSNLDNNPEALLKVGQALRQHLPNKEFPFTAEKPSQTEQAIRSMVANVHRTNGTTSTAPARPTQWSPLPDLSSYTDMSGASQDITEKDLEMPRTSQSAAETLQEAKDELMARLQDPPADENGEIIYDDEPSPDRDLPDDMVDSAEDSLEEDEEDDEDYRSPGDQERGLLTDVPLVLGPTEIEALPMIIQAGIVDNFGSKNSVERQNVKNMQAVRCHILLAQEAGRNVLRELLIFIAAWDLPDDEFYFKMMVQIMEAILKNGLMSHAYSDFGQAKDIISPAQAVVIKILTHIFRAKYSPASVQSQHEQTPSRPRLPAPLSRVDVLTVRYIFTVFRGNIVPETCALIYLQGQIRAGLALSEDFPLNLWDMERVYEGVYQFLEFFAVLTENNDWKRLLVEWEIVYDLVTLIKELDASIPKASLVQTMPPPAPPPPHPNATQPQPTPPTDSTAQPIAVERPFDPLPSTSPSPQSPPSPADPSSHSNSTSVPTPESPSLFPWRNLKKLIVLVLSSLTWKNPLVQDQIRQYVGVETILNCCNYDAHNPYIKEHAVMCLKFLLEGNKENQAVVEELEAQGVANEREVRDMGVEASVDADGRVKVRRMEENPLGRGIRRASEGNMAMGMRPDGGLHSRARDLVERQRETYGRIVGEVNEDEEV